jgi:hypothetical protein
MSLISTGRSEAIPARMAGVWTGTWRCRIFSSIFHFVIHIIDSRFGSYETLKIGLHKHLKGFGFLVDRFRENIESIDEILGRCS